ncbi:MAG: hypothetical protein R6X02_32285 [Enhygromyxa sp.]
MTTPPSRPRARRAWRWAGAALIGIGLASILGAPGVPATCTKILELATRAGEPVGEREREACEAHYGRLRASRGVLGWAWLSWCTRAAKSIPDAGEC